MPNANARASAQATPINRRAALSSLAAAGALLAVPLAAKAAPAASRVSVAYADFEAAWAVLEDANEALDDALDRRPAPERPAFDFDNDPGGHHVEPGDWDKKGGLRFVFDVSDKNVEYLRRQLANEIALPDAYSCDRVKRIEAALEKIETYKAEMARRNAAIKLPELEAAHEEALEKASSVAGVVLALDATSLRDLAMQADTALKRGHEGDEAGVLMHLIAFAGL